MNLFRLPLLPCLAALLVTHAAPAQPVDSNTIDTAIESFKYLPETPPTPPEPTAPERNNERRNRSRPHRADRIALLNPVVVEAGETVYDVIAAGSRTEINGTVEGDLHVFFGELVLGPSADIRGDLIVAGTEIQADPAARIGGDRIIIGATGTDLLGMPWLRWPQEWITHGLFYARPLPHQHAWAWSAAAFSILFFLLTALLFPKPVQSAAECLVTEPGKSFLFGLLALVLLLPLVILLAVTGVGLLLIPFVFGFTLVAYLLGKAAVYRYAGQQLGLNLQLGLLQQPMTAVLVGALLFMLLYMVPVIGLLVWCLILPLSIGAVVQLLAAATTKRLNDSTPGAAASLVLGPATPTEYGLRYLELPRAGFWVRLLATLIDLLLVGMVSKFLNLENWFLSLWIVYHVAMWAWRGTTVGGILLGLKIVRTNGAPINFPIALLRSLASFLSFVALGLGFFWAGWTPEKQSWHDRIADTFIVRLPKGRLSPEPLAAEPRS